MIQSRRYIFIDYEDLVNIKFKKLEKICTRIFVFVKSNVSSVPISLVQQMQKKGKDVKWVTVEKSKKGTTFHISFLMGKLHEKVGADIEFAILSNEKDFDPLVNFINNSGRSCIRVKQKMNHFDHEEEMEEEEEIIVDIMDDEDDEAYLHEANEYSDTNHFGESEGIGGNYEPEAEFSESTYKQEAIFEAMASASSNTEAAVAINKPKKVKKAKLQAIEKIAEETIRRLIRSGNRPSEISLLRSYILLEHQSQASPDVVEMVIEQMKDTKDIRLEETEVIYNF